MVGIWYGRHGRAWHGRGRGMVRHSREYGMAWNGRGMVWHGMVFCMAWHGMVGLWYGMAW